MSANDLHERNERLLGRQIVDTCDRAGDGNDELAHAHADGTEQQQWSTTPCLNEVQAGEGRADVDARGD